MQKIRLATTIVAAVLLVSCASAPAATPRPTAASVSGGTVTIRIGGDWGQPIDGGHTVTSQYGKNLSMAMYDRLVHLDASTGKIEPYLATSWEQTSTSITFHLRQDATCTDGSKVTPTVVYNSFQRLLSPATKSTWVANLFGPAPYTIARDDAAGTFTFGIAKPYALLAQGFSDGSAGLICPKGLESGANFAMASYGSGPYVFKSAQQGDEYVVTKRVDWTWGPRGWKATDSGFPDTLVFKVVASETTAANLMLTGNVDLASISGPDVQRLVASPGYEHRQIASGASYILFLNHAPERPTSSEVVRRAVISALDPKAWTTAAGEPDAPISTNLHASPGGYCYSDLSSLLPMPSVSAAKKVLSDAGYSLGADGKFQKDGKTLALQVVGATTTGSGAEYIADTLNQVGIRADLVNTDYNTFATNYGKANYDVLVGLWGSSSKSTPSSAPNFMVGRFPSDGGNNRINRPDPALADLVTKAFAAPSDAEACAAWKEFNTYVLKNWIARPWATGVYHWFSAAGALDYAAFSTFLDPAAIRRLK